MTLQDLLPMLESSGYAGSLEIDPTKTFSDNNIDSLDVFSWLATIEEKHGVSVSDEEFVAIKTPQDLVDFISSRID
jgi:acyl carrier protein